MKLLQPRKNFIQLLEVAAACLALSTFKTELRACAVTLWCDNVAQQGALTNGLSKNLDCAIMAGAFWELAFELRLAVFVRRVSSADNLADIPSRYNFPQGHAVLRSLDARFRHPGGLDFVKQRLQQVMHSGGCC